ncbi:Y-family DNA polymerase [Paenirhodobacter sp.]|uniref:Y-family DNA polymerase n=1 Tax=Paenirhodobacter sp. TaxID=1965326 RepID=UPI003B3F1ABA
MWFPRFAADRVQRLWPVTGPFALSQRRGNADSLYDLNRAAQAAGLRIGMPLSEARAFCAALVVRPADPRADRQMQEALRRWALRYCPWVGVEGRDGLVLDITGSAHLLGGEEALCADMAGRLARAGFSVRIGLADTRGGAWALAHTGGGAAPVGGLAAALAPLPVFALRIAPEVDTALQRLGLRRIGDVMGAARAPLARRFGQGLLDQLDRALGHLPEAVSPGAEPPRHAVRLTLPEPIGLVSDLNAGLLRLLDRLCAGLRAQEVGARSLCLTLRRVDHAALDLPLRLAAPMRDPARIAPLFARGVEGVDAGFGIDQLRLEAVVVEPMPPVQIGGQAARAERIDALITRIGTRIGLDNIHRFAPRDSHIPEKGFARVSATRGHLPQRSFAHLPATPGYARVSDRDDQPPGGSAPKAPGAAPLAGAAVPPGPGGVGAMPVSACSSGAVPVPPGPVASGVPSPRGPPGRGAPRFRFSAALLNVARKHPLCPVPDRLPQPGLPSGRPVPRRCRSGRGGRTGPLSCFRPNGWRSPATRRAACAGGGCG